MLNTGYISAQESTETQPEQQSEKGQHEDLRAETTQKEQETYLYQIQVYGITIYYLILLCFSFWFLLDVWSNNFIVLQFSGVQGEALKDPPLKLIVLIIIGGMFGSILYSIRHLGNHYAAERDYDPRWIPKYVTAPWEGAGLALIVLSLVQGGVAFFGGPSGTTVDTQSSVSNFMILGIGALVGFGMRDVVGWLNRLTNSMFNEQAPK
jgi:hypothetical protein